MKLKSWIPALLLPFLFACAHEAPIESPKPEPTIAQAVNRDLMFGHWYGEAPTKEGNIQKWLVDRRRDGTFTIKFLITDKAGKKIEDHVEAGFWGAVGDIYFTVTREFMKGESFKPMDTRDPSLYDAYRITKFDGYEFKYKELTHGDEFTVRKVTDSFKLNQ